MQHYKIVRIAGLHLSSVIKQFHDETLQLHSYDELSKVLFQIAISTQIHLQAK